MEIKNYRVNFMDGEHIYLTAHQAAEMFKVLKNGEKFIMICGNIYAVHQIKNIRRIKKEEEETKYGELKEGIEKYLNVVTLPLLE